VAHSKLLLVAVKTLMVAHVLHVVLIWNVS
jgi:hypothetical protein